MEDVDVGAHHLIRRHRQVLRQRLQSLERRRIHVGDIQVRVGQDHVGGRILNHRLHPRLLDLYSFLLRHIFPVHDVAAKLTAFREDAVDLCLQGDIPERELCCMRKHSWISQDLLDGAGIFVEPVNRPPNDFVDRDPEALLDFGFNMFECAKGSVVGVDDDQVRVCKEHISLNAIETGPHSVQRLEQLESL